MILAQIANSFKYIMYLFQGIGDLSWHSQLTLLLQQRKRYMILKDVGPSLSTTKASRNELSHFVHHLSEFDCLKQQLHLYLSKEQDPCSQTYIILGGFLLH